MMTRELCINLLRVYCKHILIIRLGDGQMRNDGFKGSAARGRLWESLRYTFNKLDETFTWLRRQVEDIMKSGQPAKGKIERLKV